MYKSAGRRQKAPVPDKGFRIKYGVFSYRRSVRRQASFFLTLHAATKQFEKSAADPKNAYVVIVDMYNRHIVRDCGDSSVEDSWLQKAAQNRLYTKLAADALVFKPLKPNPDFHLSDCPVLESEEEWDDEDVAVAMDWALEHGYEDANGNEETRAHYEAARPKWTDYEPEHVREALENDVDPFEWKPEVEAEFEYAGMGDYYGGHATRPGQALLYASYGFGTTVGDLVDEWMGELTMGFPGEEDPRWAGLSDDQLKEALEGLFIEPYNPDAIFDEDMDEPEGDEAEFDESPVAIVLLTVTTGGLKDG